MNLQDWLNNTPWAEIEECLDATDGTMSELFGEYMNTGCNDALTLTQRSVHFCSVFTMMLEAAKDYHEEQSAYNETCPHCQDNGMDCSWCGGTGKRPDNGERAAYLYDEHKDDELMKLAEAEQ